MQKRTAGTTRGADNCRNKVEKVYSLSSRKRAERKQQTEKQNKTTSQQGWGMQRATYVTNRYQMDKWVLKDKWILNGFMKTGNKKEIPNYWIG